MTNIYFIRHAESNYNNHNDLDRELTEKGLKDSELITKFLKDKNIEIVLSSPYKRSIDTIKHFAEYKGLTIKTIDDFRERKVDNKWIKDFELFCRNQWNNFSYKLSNGENLREVQERNINALEEVLNIYEDKNIIIGSHGTALSTIINHYDKLFGYDEFKKIKNLMPWIVKLAFEKKQIKSIDMINIFSI